jgi:hypothetical protein
MDKFFLRKLMHNMKKAKVIYARMLVMPFPYISPEISPLNQIQLMYYATSLSITHHQLRRRKKAATRKSSATNLTSLLTGMRKKFHLRNQQNYRRKLAINPFVAIEKQSTRY